MTRPAVGEKGAVLRREGPYSSHMIEWRRARDAGTLAGPPDRGAVRRLIRGCGESRERRAQATHPAAVKPELAADGPNQVYSWDITKLHGPAKWTYYHLYVILDIYSRYAVGWMVATRESAALAEKLIAATCAKQGHHPRPAEHPRRPRFLNDLQAGGAAAGGPGRHPVPLPPARPQRQPVLRGAVQDAEVPAGLPRPVPLDRSRPGALPGLLPLVQLRAPPRQARPAHRRRHPLRPGRSRPGRTLRPQATCAAGTTRHILDQPTPGKRSRHSVKPANGAPDRLTDSASVRGAMLFRRSCVCWAVAGAGGQATVAGTGNTPPAGVDPRRGQSKEGKVAA
jgi:hypothetical protein